MVAGGHLLLKEVNWSEGSNKLSYHPFEIPSPLLPPRQIFSGLSGSETRTSTVSEKSYPSGPEVPAHTCSQL